MAILRQHLKYYREIFAIPEVLSEPFLTIGFQDFLGDNFPSDFRFRTLEEFMKQRGFDKIEALDLFDERAHIRHDLNTPVPLNLQEKYKTVFDIGSIEHVFDARQCLENCLRMVSVGGCYGLVTTVHGYYGHGLNVFHHSYFTNALKQNNFDVLYLKFTSFAGEEIQHPQDALNSLIWLVARKKMAMKKFEMPQQDRWEPYYQNREYSAKPSTRSLKSVGKAIGRKFTRHCLRPVWGMLWKLRRKIIEAFNITEF